MTSKRNYTKEELHDLKRSHIGYRIGIIILTVICILSVLGVRSCEREKQQKEEIQFALLQDSIRRAREAERESIYQIQESQRQRWLDSVAAIPKPEPVEPPKPEPPKYSWSHLEAMVRELSNENYYSSVWKVDDDTSAWMVIYEKSGRYYILKFNPETDTFGKPTRLRYYEAGQYHVWGDKSRLYKYDRNELVYEVNGVEKARYFNRRTITLFTPEYVPDGYDDWDEYYEDNE